MIKNSDHNTYIDNPGRLVEVIDGFITETIKNTFEEKDRNIFAPKQGNTSTTKTF